MTRYEVGELVDAQIKGARVQAFTKVLDTDLIRLALGEDELELVLTKGVTVARIAPAEWPPQASDLWDVPWAIWGPDGKHLVVEQFFARREMDDEQDYGVRLVDSDGERGYSLAPDEVLQRAEGRPVLAYRKGWTPTAPTVDVEGDPADERERAEGRDAIIAGLRGLADRLEANPDLPLPSSWDIGVDTGWTIPEENWRSPSAEEEIERISVWAAAFGVEHGERRVGDKIHHTAQCGISGLRMHMSCIVPALTDSTPPTSVAGADDAPAPATGKVTASSAPTFVLGPVDDEEPPFITDCVHCGQRIRQAAMPGTYWLHIETAEAGCANGSTVAEPEHKHAGGTSGPAGTNVASCTCGVTYAGFDTYRESSAMLDAHIAEAGRDRDPAVEPDADGDLIAPAEPLSDEAIDGAVVALARAIDADPTLLEEPAAPSGVEPQPDAAGDEAEQLRTPDEWLRLVKPGLRVEDPDGWRGIGGRPWTDAISRSEFERRLMTCTVSSMPLADENALAGGAATAEDLS